MKRKTAAWLVSFFAAALVFETIFSFLPLSGSNETVVFRVKQGDSAAAAASELCESRLIRSRSAFLLICRLGGRASNIKPGVYKLRPSMTPSQILAVLEKGAGNMISITLPEGYNVKQIEELIEKEGMTSDGFAGLDRDQYSFLGNYSLEGYLFPDTYFVDKGLGSASFAKEMLDNFENKVIKPYSNDVAKVAKRRLSTTDFNAGLNKILIVASLIEREAQTEKDRPLIASVIWNRLNKNMRLEIDATLSYTPGVSMGNKERIYYSDLNKSSAYNTYRNKGLPPTPICNPGIRSIEAALRPASTNYLFYVAKKDGSHVFTRTFKEHVAAKKAVRN